MARHRTLRLILARQAYTAGNSVFAPRLPLKFASRFIFFPLE